MREVVRVRTAEVLHHELLRGSLPCTHRVTGAIAVNHC